MTEQIFDFIKRFLGASLPLGGGGLSVGDLLIAAFIVLIAYLVARYAERLLDRSVLSHANLTANTRFVLRRATRFSILTIGALIALNILQLRLTSLAVVFGFLSVGIGFGLQNITSNFVSGIILLFERPIRVGDVVTVDETTGTVQAINIRSTLITTADNVEIIVPNSKFIEQAVINWTYRDRSLRVTVPVGVAYGSDVEQVRRVLLDVARAHEKVLSEPVPFVRFTGFGESSLDFELYVWVPEPGERFDIVSDLNFAIDAAFREHGIEIPFPRRDVRLLNEAPSVHSGDQSNSPSSG